MSHYPVFRQSYQLRDAPSPARSHSRPLVIPAKAGIQRAGSNGGNSASHVKWTANGLASRFRGNDCAGERPFLANDAAIPF